VSQQTLDFLGVKLVEPKAVPTSPEKKSKFEDRSGEFWLGGKRVKYVFKGEYFANVPHIEFTSDEPTLISETKYRSYFTDYGQVNYYNTFEEMMKACVIAIISEGKKKPSIPSITFEKPKDVENPIEKPKVEKQTAFIDIERRSNGEYAIFPKIEGQMNFAFHTGKTGEAIEKQKIEELTEILKKDYVFQGVKEHTYTYHDDEPKYIEKKIEDLSSELKKYLTKKFGYEVTIRVLKGGGKC
jgi:hypothetical protein